MKDGTPIVSTDILFVSIYADEMPGSSMFSRFEVFSPSGEIGQFSALYS